MYASMSEALTVRVNLSGLFRVIPRTAESRPRTRQRVPRLMTAAVMLAVLGAVLGQGVTVVTPVDDGAPTPAPTVARDLVGDRHSRISALELLWPTQAATLAPPPPRAERELDLSAPATTPGLPPTSEPEWDRYIVRDDDTLSDIAARVGTTVDALMRRNGIGDPDTIYADDELMVPRRPGGPNLVTPPARAQS